MVSHLKSEKTKQKQAEYVGTISRHAKGHSESEDTCSNKETSFIPEWYNIRGNVHQALINYRKLLVNKEERNMLAQKYGMTQERKCNGLHLHKRVVRLLEVSDGCVNTTKQMGSVAGIEVGDQFHWRGELCVIGLHSDLQRGIDSITSISGKSWATSIVDSGRFDNVRVSSKEFTYCGQGDNPSYGELNKKHKDQKLDGRNQALMNNMTDKKPVRVIRKYSSIVSANESGYKFVYEGLYQVIGCKKRRGDYGKYIYEFKLAKLEDDRQYDLRWKIAGRTHRHQF
ncbi:hypothetical protein V6N13_105799 [Hibiscus sabdariffa]|uniref:YDG domain-containing protein n=1 Tax=Hibiscus sabdariffa TaxID=183260 RepID=A0ABR2EYS8_9ROSI